MMPPRIGPIHGVQPAANAMPRAAEPIIPRGLSSEKQRVSLYSAEILSRPINCRPKAMITRPPIIRTHGLLVIAAPTNPAVVPRTRKITKRPALDDSDLTITARRLLVPSFNPSILTPEISEI